MKKVLAILLCLSVLLCFMPTAAFAAEDGGQTPASSGGEGETGGQGEAAYVAKIGAEQYATLDAAIAAAADGAEIELLADCRMTVDTISKPITIKGNGKTVTVEPNDQDDEHNGSLWLYAALTFKNTKVFFSNNNDIIPDFGVWGLILRGTSSFNLKDASRCEFQYSGIYVEGDNDKNYGEINVDNGSALYLKNAKYTALMSENHHNEGQLYAGCLNVTNKSWFEITDVEVAGMNGISALKINVNDSDFNIRNCYNQGLVHCELSLDNSRSEISGNADGISGYDDKVLTMKNSSSLNMQNNREAALLVTSGSVEVASDCKLTIENTGMDLSEKQTHAPYYAGVSVRKAEGSVKFEDGAEVQIINNGVSGIYNRGTCEIGSTTVITGNGSKVCNTNYGGGIDNSGIITVNQGAEIYNNHAALAGDDIYCSEKDTEKITFGAVGTDWILDDCSHAIDGWYDDSETEGRWEAHQKPLHYKEYTGFENGEATSGLLALKAAHGLKAITPDDPSEKANISKSKTATNLNSNYESDITLSLPSTEQNLASDVMLVLDASKCTKDTMEATVKLLENLAVQQQTGANIKVGIVMFKGNAVAFQKFGDNDAAANLKINQELQKTMKGLIAADDPDGSKTKAAVRAYVVSHFTEEKIGYSFMNSGTNLPAGLQLAKEMLAGDTKVDDARKYVVLVSDGSTYLYMHDNNYKEAYSRTVEPGSYKGGIYETETVETNSPATPPGNYTNKYDVTKASDWLTWAEYIAENNAKFEQYDFKVEVAGEVPADAVKIPKSISDRIINSYVSVMQTAELYQELQSRYNCYYCHIYDSENDNGRNMLKALTDSERLIDAKEQGENIFQSIEKDILYLVGEDSYVTDYMGYTADYNFDFVNDASKLSMTVGQGADAKTYPAEKIAENKYGFAPVEIEIMSDNHEIVKQYLYELEYFEGDKQGNEYFKWTFHTPVTNFTPVQLHYTVKLMNPKTESGTYGTYDADGSKHYEGLLTNNSATLYPVDSDGQAGVPEEFAKPTVSYTVGGGSYNPPTTADGTVKVVKTVSGVEIPAGYRVDVTFTGAAGTKTLSITDFVGSSGSGTLSLQPGTYTYTETATGIDGYQYVVQQGTVTVEAGKTTEILLSNVYTKDAEEPTTPDKPTKPTKPEQPTKPEDKTEVPKTSDNSALAGSALLLLLSACGLAAALRRKEEK